MEKGRKVGQSNNKIYEWILGLGRKTPNYIIKEETEIKEIKIEAIRRAVKYEEETRQLEKKIVMKFMKKMEKEEKKGEVSKWERWRQEVI